jgi:melibiase-like protein/alpha galactosidase C-like protein
MNKFLTGLIAVSLTVGAETAKAANSMTVSGEGWTITTDGGQGVLTISYDNLGTLMDQVRLNLLDDHGLRLLRDWTVEKMGSKGLSIRTSEPPTGWSIEWGKDTLKISSTSTSALVTAEVPASQERTLARLMDPEGVPVDWTGTDEVLHTYGGSETWNQSYLPTRNPEVMYFALGQVAISNFHSLFDRKTDTGISFSSQTRLKRNHQNQDLLDAAIPVPGNTQVRLIPDYYTKTLGVPFYVPFDDSCFTKPPAAWNSWDNYYAEVREEDIVRNADWIADHLKPYGLEYVVLDAGYDGEDNTASSVGKNHCWIGKWDGEKFPHGPQWLTNHIKSKGLRAGLWLVPNAYACAVEQHPDWYLRYKDGKIVRDYDTPALDSTNPEVLNFLKEEFITLDDWGFDYYKFDGEHALPKYVPNLDSERLYDKSIDPLVAYRNRLKLIRDTIGSKRFIEGCPAGTPLNGIGNFNSYFTGDDMYPSWQGQYALFSSINANAFLNHIVIYLMPGEGIEVGPPMTVEEAKRKRVPSVVETAHTREDPMVGFGTTLPEARTLVSWVSLTGVVYSLASVMPELQEERVRLLKMTLPTMPILPVDLFSRGTDMKWDRFKTTQPDYYIHNYAEILDLKVNAKSGVYDVVALTNWRSGTAERELSFTDKLGLSAGTRYVVFDYWAQKLLGVFEDKMKVEVPSHDTRVLLIHPWLNHPQLIGTSRHITGAYSIRDLAWDAAKNTLRGSSETVPQETYTLFSYVPEGVTVSRVRATAGGAREVPVWHELSGNSLRVSFQGQPEVVDWQIEFTPKHEGRTSGKRTP